MKRLWFGIGLLVLFLVLGIVTVEMLQAAQTPIVQALEEASACALKGDLSRGVQLADAAAAGWQSSWHWVAAVATHNPMDEIDSLFARLPAFAAAGQNGDFAAGCLRLARLIDAVADAHRFSWWNLL